MDDNERIARRALQMADELRRAEPQHNDFSDGWQQRYLERQSERLERALEMARREAARGVDAPAPTLDSAAFFAASATPPLCPHCGTHEVSQQQTCHNSACEAYARDVTIYEGWKSTAGVALSQAPSEPEEQPPSETEFPA